MSGLMSVIANSHATAPLTPTTTGDTSLVQGNATLDS
jgi:hypothetical protein